MLKTYLFDDRSLFTMYCSVSQASPDCLWYLSIIIEGIGDVHCVVVGGKSILFRFWDPWHVQVLSSPHHFLSSSTALSLGQQVMLAGRSPRMIYSHKASSCPTKSAKVHVSMVFLCSNSTSRFQSRFLFPHSLRQRQHNLLLRLFFLCRHPYIICLPASRSIAVRVTVLFRVRVRLLNKFLSQALQVLLLRLSAWAWVNFW